MKKLLALLFLASASIIPLSAQHHHPQGGKPCTPPIKVEEMVGNLSASQKKRLLVAQERSHARVEDLKAQLNAVRDSIRDITHRDGDNSKILFPLFDREGSLQAQISKEMYSLRTQIDAILSPEQLKVFRQALEKNRGDKSRRRKP